MKKEIRFFVPVDDIFAKDLSKGGAYTIKISRRWTLKMSRKNGPKVLI